jgi:Glyoxalase-like domain
MNPQQAPAVELRLLTNRPEEMVQWWSALLGAPPRPETARSTSIADARLRVVIERSQIAFDYHPEASGVTAINLAFEELKTIRGAAERLARLGSRPYRATRRGALTALWFRDPNRTEVALYLPAAGAAPTAEQDGWPEELDPHAVLSELRPHD